MLLPGYKYLVFLFFLYSFNKIINVYRLFIDLFSTIRFILLNILWDKISKLNRKLTVNRYLELKDHEFKASCFFY